MIQKAEMDQQEKRRSPRVRAETGSRGQLKATIPVTILNASTIGVLIELSAPLRPGSTYDLSAQLLGVHVNVLVRVTRCRAGGFIPDGKGGRLLQFRAGAEFVGLTRTQLDAIKGAVDKGESGATLKTN
jgi:hypothetical protein